jgi:hypothetical protein
MRFAEASEAESNGPILYVEQILKLAPLVIQPPPNGQPNDHGEPEQIAEGEADTHGGPIHCVPGARRDRKGYS